MNKLITLLLLLAFCFSPTLQAQQRVPKQKDSVRPMLSELRKKNAAKYKEARNRLRNQPKSVKRVYRFQRCTPCDTRYVASLLKKEKLTKAEIRNLICTNQPECSSNAEFREIFNELVHQTIDRVPDRFFDTYEEERQRKFLTELDIEILNPVNDRITNEGVLKSLKTRIDRKANSNIQPVMLRRLEGKLESKIKLRNTELIKRKALIQRQGGN